MYMYVLWTYGQTGEDLPSRLRASVHIGLDLICGPGTAVDMLCVCLHVQTIVVERNDLLARFGGFTLTFLDQVSRQMPSLKLQ